MSSAGNGNGNGAAIRLQGNVTHDILEEDLVRLLTGDGRLELLAAGPQALSEEGGSEISSPSAASTAPSSPFVPSSSPVAAAPSSLASDPPSPSSVTGDGSEGVGVAAGGAGAGAGAAGGRGYGAPHVWLNDFGPSVPFPKSLVCFMFSSTVGGSPYRVASVPWQWNPTLSKFVFAPPPRQPDDDVSAPVFAYAVWLADRGNGNGNPSELIGAFRKVLLGALDYRATADTGQINDLVVQMGEMRISRNEPRTHRTHNKVRGGHVRKPEPLNWKFTQSFGDDNSSDDDLVTTMQFDSTGTFLAVGDKAGRICVFEGTEAMISPTQSFMDYRFYTEFQSHDVEFDPLKSLEIEEKINTIEWLHDHPQSGRLMLSSNDKTVKLWKLQERRLYDLDEASSAAHACQQAGMLVIPPLPAYQPVKMASLKRVFGKAHQYHINSVSECSDRINFVSADDLRVNLWNLEVENECFTVVDTKPEDLQNLSEVITTTRFHPSHCNLLLYGTSRGNIRVVDMRVRALCDQWSQQFENEATDPANNFFSEIISSVSDARFTPDGRFILSRDYLTLKIWDSHMEREPVRVIPVHQYLTPYLAELYENDCIFDKFMCASDNGSRFITGSYNNNFLVHDSILGTSTTFEARDDPRENTNIVPENPDVQLMDFAKKALHVSWHPTEDVLAVAGMNKIYIYQAISTFGLHDGL